MTGITFPLAALIVMLWIIWRDSVNPRRSSRMVYYFRMILFVAVGGVLIFNFIAWPSMFAATSARVLVIVTLLASIGGAVYFFRIAHDPRRSR